LEGLRAYGRLNNVKLSDQRMRILAPLIKRTLQSARTLDKVRLSDDVEPQSYLLLLSCSTWRTKVEPFKA
jgi:hypothetical protein